jgi:hypothetical protein
LRVTGAFSGSGIEATIDLQHTGLVYVGHEKRLGLKLTRPTSDESVTLEARLFEWDVFWDTGNAKRIVTNQTNAPAVGADVKFSVADENSQVGNPHDYCDWYGCASTGYQLSYRLPITATVSYQDMVETISKSFENNGSWAQMSELKTALSLSSMTLTACVTEETWRQRFNTARNCMEYSGRTSLPAPYAALSWSIGGDATILTSDSMADSAGIGEAILKLGTIPATAQATGSYEGRTSTASAPVPLPTKNAAGVQKPLIESRWAYSGVTGGHNDFVQGTWVYGDGTIGGVNADGTPSEWILCPGYDFNDTCPTRATAAQDYKGWIRENWPLDDVGAFNNSDGSTGPLTSINAARAALDVSGLDWLPGLTKDVVTSTTFNGPYGAGSDPVFHGKPGYNPSSGGDPFVTIASQSGSKKGFIGGSLEVRLARPAGGDIEEPLEMEFYVTETLISASGGTNQSAIKTTLYIKAGETYSNEKDPAGKIQLVANAQTNGSSETRTIGIPQTLELKIVRRAEENLAIGTQHQKSAANVWDTTIVTRQKDPSVRDPEDVMIEVTGVPEELKTQISWTGATAESTNPLQAKVSRNAVGDFPISIRAGNAGMATATLKVVWGTVSIFNQDSDTKPADCEVTDAQSGWLPNGHRPGIAYGTWNRMVGQFTIDPASLRTVPGTKFIIESRIVKTASSIYDKRPAFPESWRFDGNGIDLSNTDSTLSEQGHLYYEDMPGWQTGGPEGSTRAAQKGNFTHTVFLEMPDDRGGSGKKKLRIAEIGKWHTVSFCKKVNGQWVRDNDPGAENSIGPDHKPFTWNELDP